MKDITQLFGPYALVQLPIIAPVAMFFGWRFCYGAMRRKRVERPPVAAYAVLFFTLGGWIAALFVPDVGFVYGWLNLIAMSLVAIEESLAVYIAPFFTVWIVISLFRRRKESGFHNVAFWGAAVYTGAILVMLAGWATTRLFFAANVGR